MYLGPDFFRVIESADSDINNKSSQQFPGGKVLSGAHIDFFGMRYIIPMVRQWQGTTVAVNVGGAIVPTLLSLYLLVKNKFYGRALAGVILVTIVVHMVSHPVRGLGFADPLFVPPLVATAAGLIFARKSAPALAYIFQGLWAPSSARTC